MNKKKESSPIKTPDCAKYAPNKFYVMKRTLETTKWKTRKIRIFYSIQIMIPMIHNL